MRRTAVAFAILLLVLAVAIPAYAESPLNKATGKDASVIWPAFVVYPGTAYDNPYSHLYASATGKVNMIQPRGDIDVILAVSADGLTPGISYMVHFDTNGNSWPSGWGPFVDKGSFVADEYGHGEWNYTAPAGTLTPGSYVYSVYLTRSFPPNRTVLISENVCFEVMAE